MTKKHEISKAAQASDEQIAYANLLSLCTRIGMGILVVTYALYILEIVPAHVPLRDLIGYLALPTHEYIEKSGMPSGWGWVAMVYKGDMLNLVGIAFLAFITIICFLNMIPVLAKKGDKIYMTIAIVEVAVLLFAASGILKAGGH